MTYIELFASAAERRRILQNKFGFVCSCPACSAAGNELRESNERRSLLAALNGQIRDCAVCSPEKAMAGLPTASLALLFSSAHELDSWHKKEVEPTIHMVIPGDSFQPALSAWAPVWAVSWHLRMQRLSCCTA